MESDLIYHIVQCRLIDGDPHNPTDQKIVATYHDEWDALDAINAWRKAWEGDGECVLGSERNITSSTHRIFIWEVAHGMYGLFTK